MKQEPKIKVNGFHAGYLLFGSICEQCINNTLGYTLRKRIKCLDPKECPLVNTNHHNQKPE